MPIESFEHAASDFEYSLIQAILGVSMHPSKGTYGETNHLLLGVFRGLPRFDEPVKLGCGVSETQHDVNVCIVWTAKSRDKKQTDRSHPLREPLKFH